MKYVIAIHGKVHSVDKRVERVEHQLASGSDISSSSSEEGVRPKLPCTTVQELEELENLLASKPAAFRDLVRRKDMYEM